MASDRLLPLGEFHLAALAETPAETGALIEVFRPSHDALATAAAARAAAERMMILPRVALRFSERRLETAIRRVSNVAESIDGKEGGKVWRALFPNGLNAETRPRSAAQRAAADALMNRLTTQTLTEPLRSEHVPLLRVAIDDLAAKLAARKDAADALGLAFAQELAAREDFVRAYDASAGAIRAQFPRDRETQDLYFDSFRSSRRGGSGVDPSPNEDE